MAPTAAVGHGEADVVARLLAEPDGTFMRTDRSDLNVDLDNLGFESGVDALHATARLTDLQLGVFTATLELDDAAAPSDADVVLPGPVVWHREHAPRIPDGHNVRVVFLADEVTTSARVAGAYAVTPAGTRVRVVRYVPADGASGTVGVLHVMEVPTGPAVFDAEAFRRVREATLARLAREQAGTNSQDNPVVRPRLFNVFGGLASGAGVVRFGAEFKWWFPNECGDEVGRRHAAVGEAFVHRGLMTSPSQEEHHAAYDRPYTDRSDDFRFEREGDHGGELITPIMRDLASWWRRVVDGLDAIRDHDGVAVWDSNGNLHVGIEYFGGRPGAEDVAAVNRLVDLFYHYADVLYRMAYNWSSGGRQVDLYHNSPIIDWVTGLAGRLPNRLTAVNMLHVMGSELDRVEFRFLAGTLDLGALQAQFAMVVGLMAWARRGGPPEGSTPQPLGVNWVRSVAGHDDAAPEGGLASFLEFVNTDTVFGGQPDVQRQLAQQFVAGRWVALDIADMWQQIRDIPRTGEERMRLDVAYDLYDLVRQSLGRTCVILMGRSDR